MDEGALVDVLVVDAELWGHFENGLLLRCEGGAAVGGGVVQRLDAEGVAGEEELLLHRVPDGDAEHAAQMLDDVGAPVVKADHDGLSVARGVEGIACVGQLPAEFHVVVDLAVERHGVTVRLVFGAPHERLVRMLQVDDRQAVETEHDVVVVPRARFIRAAVAHAGQRALDGGHELRGIGAGRENSEETAHGFTRTPFVGEGDR